MEKINSAPGETDESRTPQPSPIQFTMSDKITSRIASMASGDARKALSLLEVALRSPNDAPEGQVMEALKQSLIVSYDRTGEGHYDMISALHKSVRGSDGSAAMYWLARMLTAGEDPLFVARRMVVCASEDIGLADSHALPLVRGLDSLLENLNLLWDYFKRPWLHSKHVK
jgi:putative ATPase